MAVSRNFGGGIERSADRSSINTASALAWVARRDAEKSVQQKHEHIEAMRLCGPVANISKADDDSNMKSVQRSAKALTTMPAATIVRPPKPQPPSHDWLHRLGESLNIKGK